MLLAMNRRSVRWAPRCSGFVLFAVAACGGRVSVPGGSASGEKTPDITVAPTDSSLGEGPPSLREAEGASAEEGQVDSSVGDADANVEAGEGGDASMDEPNASVVCAPVQDLTYYVDPSAGVDDASSTGTASCPFRSLTRAISVIGPDGGAGATIKIVNDASAPVLGPSTGEVFPIQLPANVTIVAGDTTKNLPTLRATTSLVDALLLTTGDNLSYLVVDGAGILVEGQAGGIDHVTVRNAGRGIDVEEGSVSLGPGVVSQNNSEPGLFLLGVSAVHITGGRGSEHTSFSGNLQGISVRDNSSVVIDGADIDPAHPDESDVDTDDNVGAGFVMGTFGLPLTRASVVRGLHTSGNTNGLEVEPCAAFTLRASYLGHNRLSGVYVALTVSNDGGCACSSSCAGGLDLGNPAGGDYGRNIFESPDTSAASSICVNFTGLPPPLSTVLAAGNIFGNNDCALGGELLRSAACAGGFDIGGIAPDGGTGIDVSNCQ
jgi:hypothetical protein